jgi:hypothetical protein
MQAIRSAPASHKRSTAGELRALAASPSAFESATPAPEKGPLGARSRLRTDPRHSATRPVPAVRIPPERPRRARSTSRAPPASDCRTSTYLRWRGPYFAGFVSPLFSPLEGDEAGRPETPCNVYVFVFVQLRSSDSRAEFCQGGRRGFEFPPPRGARSLERSVFTLGYRDDARRASSSLAS